MAEKYPSDKPKGSEKREIKNSKTMAKVIDESFKKQLSKRMDFFLKPIGGINLS